MEQLHPCATTTKPINHCWRVAPTCCTGKPHSATKTQHRHHLFEDDQAYLLHPSTQLMLIAPQITHGAFQVALVVKNPPANARDISDMGSIPGSGRSPGGAHGSPPGGAHGSPLQYSCLENPMDRGAWRATVHRVAKSRTLLKQLSTRVHKVPHTEHLKPFTMSLWKRPDKEEEKSWWQDSMSVY